MYGAQVPGYPSLFVGIMVLGGVQLIMIGVMGEYIGKILEEIKGRPVYFVAEHDVKHAQDSERPASAQPRRRGRAPPPNERTIRSRHGAFGSSPTTTASRPP